VNVAKATKMTAYMKMRMRMGYRTFPMCDPCTAQAMLGQTAPPDMAAVNPVETSLVCLPMPHRVMAKRVGNIGPSKQTSNIRQTNAPPEFGSDMVRAEVTRHPAAHTKRITRPGMPLKQAKAAMN
jgi:hypothetical protein